MEGMTPREFLFSNRISKYPEKKQKNVLSQFLFFFFLSYNILISGTNVRKRSGSHHDRKKQESMIFPIQFKTLFHCIIYEFP